ncbi:MULTISPECIES: glucose PTS transporter subunit IIA [Symbiopectobacterium]|uniref:glucose PTS transporter subunit IIA n=1 Tax=Symbiopectobacterium TaxID=801 RepID=UPI001A1B8CD1|nr:MULTISPECIES: glucose PTS transporter subunit IIA [Symbiopectobacterium]MBG6248081.1 PTS beta-glucoside transporter subunit EIIBCA [Candidatus Symbiopectobacterium sp. PLON1]MBT9430641.1 PTS glucose transporter subunit IIA [Candidatus Symbiopectobacterium endolongispinus]
MSNFRLLAGEILELIGGEKNVGSLTHCITRLRFSLKDGTKFNKAALDKLDGVILAVESNNQYQVVIGNDVSTVYRLLVDEFGIKGGATSDSESGSDGKKGNMVGHLFNKMSSILVPIVPALAGAGMLKAFLVILSTYHFIDTAGSTYKILAAASNSVFYFLPLLLAFSCAKAFNAHQFVSVAIVGALLEPTFTGLMAKQGDIVEFLGVPVVLMKYSSTLIPAILAIWAYSYLERLLKRLIHQSIEMVSVPMLGMLIMVPVMFNNLALRGFDTIKPATAAATFAQAGAAFGVFLKAKNKKLKSFALSSMVPALFAGVTESIVYGISIKYKRPLVASLIAGTVAGGFIGSMGTTVMAYIFPALTTLPAFMATTFAYYLIGIGMSFTLSALLTYLLGFDESLGESSTAGAKTPKTATPSAPLTTAGSQSLLPGITLVAPLNGTIVPLTSVKDAVFASEIIGKGIAILTSEGVVTSPVNGVVSKLFHSKHAIGITSDYGVEVLVHVEIDTVRLNGEHFASHVNEGDRVTTGQLLVTFDLEALIAKDFDVTTPVVIANTDDYQSISATEQPRVTNNTLMTLFSATV